MLKIKLNKLLCLSVLPLTLGFTKNIFAQAADVAFFVVNKSRIVRQDNEGNRNLVGYFSNAEMFKKADGKILKAWRSGSGTAASAPTLDLHDEGRMLNVESGPYNSVESLDKIFPNGTYRIHASTPSGDIDGWEVVLSGTDGKTEIADTALAKFSQQGKSVSLDQIDPGQELQVSWNDMVIGKTDAKGILDDLIIVLTFDCNKKLVNRSPLPFLSKEPYLRFSAKQHVIPAGTFNAGQSYEMILEHINVVDTIERNGVYGVAAYADINKINLQTIGEPSEECRN